MVAGAITGLRCVIDAKMMAALLIDLNEIVASAKDELESVFAASGHELTIPRDCCLRLYAERARVRHSM